MSVFKLPCTLYPGLEGNKLQQKSVPYVDEYSYLCLNYPVLSTLGWRGTSNGRAKVCVRGAAAPGGTFIGSAVLSNTSCSATGNELQQKSVHYVDEYSCLCLNYLVLSTPGWRGMSCNKSQFTTLMNIHVSV